MLPGVQWVSRVDRMVLDWLDSVDSVPAAPPKTIFIALENGDPSYNHLLSRLRKLERAGFLKRHPEAESHYMLTDKGQAFVNGEGQPEDYPDPDPDE